MKTSLYFVLALMSLSLVAFGCARDATNKPESAGAPIANGSEKEYDIKGKVVAIGEDKKSVTLDHEDVVGLMKGMKMEFRVNDAKVLEGIETGDEVTGRLRVSDGTYTITKLEKP